MKDIDKSGNEPNSKPEASELALLQEYQSCEDYVDAAASRDWQAAGIIWAAALVGLFIVAFAGSTLANAVITTVLMLFVIATLWLFWSMLSRMIFLQIACRQRMREIECQLRMRKDIYLYLFDHWNTREKSDYWKYLSEDEKRNLETNYVKKGKGAPRLHTGTATKYINVGIMLAWAALTTLKWLTYAGLLT